jgi:branched-subunit amino acid transport protein
MMTVLLLVLASTLVTWGLRVLLIGVVPADRLPARLQAVLDDVAPIVLAAMLATTVVAGGGRAALTSPTTFAVLAGAIVAWRTGHLVGTVATAVAAAGLASLFL